MTLSWHRALFAAPERTVVNLGVQLRGDIDEAPCHLRTVETCVRSKFRRATEDREVAGSERKLRLVESSDLMIEVPQLAGKTGDELLEMTFCPDYFTFAFLQRCLAHPMRPAQLNS